MHVVGEDGHRPCCREALDAGDGRADRVGFGPPAGVGQQGPHQGEVAAPVGLVGGGGPDGDGSTGQIVGRHDQQAGLADPGFAYEVDEGAVALRQRLDGVVQDCRLL